MGHYKYGTGSTPSTCTRNLTVVKLVSLLKCKIEPEKAIVMEDGSLESRRIRAIEKAITKLATQRRAIEFNLVIVIDYTAEL
jgi:hypothetical protein